MDDIVLQAMVKWPKVPHCYGWLGLDARGSWYMRDDAAQAAGPFAAADGGTPHSKGSRLQHDKLIDFIGRNYACDAQGRWYFQNGPQRVYVVLEATPWVWRLDATGRVTAHTGQSATPRACLLDEQGRLYLDTTEGFGLLHTQDVGLAADLIEASPKGATWTPQDVLAADLPKRFGYVREPQPPKG